MGSAAGATLTAATRVGVPAQDYERRVAAGEKWYTGHRAWHPRTEFAADASRGDGLMPSCRSIRNERARANRTPTVRAKPPGPAADAPRDGDRRQARRRINVEVRSGRRPHPNTLPCTDCGHVWQVGERRHEYDHHLGYAAEHHYDVEPVCTRCHHARTSA